MRLHLEHERVLTFDDGSPVRHASALAPLGSGWLVVQDDATSAAWLVDGRVQLLQVLPGMNDSADGAFAQIGAACGLPLEDGPGALLLGSGSSSGQRRGGLVHTGAEPAVEVGDLGGLFDAVARVLELPEATLDLQGIARNGGVLRWFQRGVGAQLPNSSVDVDMAGLVEALRGRGDSADVALRSVRRYDLGEVGGVALGATDAVALPGGRVLLSAVAEVTPNAQHGGPLAGAVLALLDGDSVIDVAELPRVSGAVRKLEGLGVLELLPDGARLLAIVDAVDPLAASLALTLRACWDRASS